MLLYTLDLTLSQGPTSHHVGNNLSKGAINDILNQTSQAKLQEAVIYWTADRLLSTQQYTASTLQLHSLRQGGAQWPFRYSVCATQLGAF